jgi:amino acid adenylation domain-containing protein
MTTLHDTGLSLGPARGGQGDDATEPGLPSDWKSRIIMGDTLGGTDAPAWVEQSYATMRTHVMDPEYPCFFGTMAEKRGEMFYSYVSGKDTGHLARTMAMFSRLATRPEFEKNNIAVFFEPDARPLSHQQYHDFFWRILQDLHDADPHPGVRAQPDPADPEWEFSYAGVEMFVVCACPSFAARHSRNLGPGMILLFQPRSVFVDKVTNRAIGMQARETVRRRLKKWDAIPAHPDLGFYGDPENLEWKQYFLPDENVPIQGNCPLKSRSENARGAKPGPADALREIAVSYAALPADKRRAFRKALGDRGIAAARLPIVALADAPAQAPLSFAQERLWFLWRLDPASPAYNISTAVHLAGRLSVPAVRAAIDGLVSRHDVLRTRFLERDGVPLQVLDPALRPQWEEMDVAEANWRDSMPARVAEHAGRPFDLVAGPLLRVALWHAGESEHVLQLCLHHIVSDAWSQDILVREFAALYRDAVAGRVPEPPQAGLGYREYAIWQREWHDDRAFKSQENYWRKRLGTEHPVLPLPVDRKRGALRGSAGGRVKARVAADTASRIAMLARAAGSTSFVVLLAAYSALLYRYSGQRDIRVGIPVAGRDRPDTQGLVGFFVNTVVARTDLQGAMSFDQLLRQVAAAMTEIQENQDYPFARLVEVLQPSRSVADTPLFRVVFNHSTGQAEGISLPGLDVLPLEGEGVRVRFDLALNVHEADGEYRLSLAYASDILERETAQRMLDHYADILDQATRQADQPLASLSLAPGIAAPPRIPVSTVSTESAESEAWPAHEGFRVQAMRQPHAPALHCGARTLTYGELDAWSDRIAARLLAMGASPDDRIGLCAARSPALIAGVLGILKSGAAFVPLDPAYPAQRLAAMVEDAGIGMVVTDTGTRADLPWLATHALIDADEAARQAGAPVHVPVHPEQLAYVIYTSGSTGVPKGVAVSHAALSAHLHDFIACHAIGPGDRVLQSSTINFDVFLHELFPALWRGGQVEMRGDQPWDLHAMSRCLVERGVTFARIPTAYWQQWLRELPDPAGLESLRQITVGGEALPGDALRAWKESALGHIGVANLYGPTETTIACTVRQTTWEDAAETIAPIGVPYASRAVYVMDGDGNQVPAGVEGELCIGGHTVARGYLCRPDLTADRFVPDPYGSPGARMYRSGDLCTRRVDGVVCYIGRADRQIKLRGFRIELGDIETALRRCTGVREAVVELRGQGQMQRLVAYVVGAASEPALRASLQAALPGHMVPSAFVPMDALPMMANGKVDRAALPDAGTAGTPRKQVPARHPTEAALLAIWKSVLGRDDLGIRDNFFEAGGNSLLVLRAVAMADARGLRGVSIPAFFAHPTIEAMAAALRAQTRTDAPGALCALPLNEPGRAVTVFAVHPVYGLALDYQTLARQLQGRVHVVGLQFPFDAPRESWPRYLGELASVYVAAMKAIQPVGPYRMLGWSLGGLIAMEIAHRLEQQGDSLDFVGLVDAKTPLQRRLDLLGKNAAWRFDPAVRDEDRATLINALARKQWDAPTAARLGSADVSARIILAARHIRGLVSAGVDRRIDAPLSVWWSSQVMDATQKRHTDDWDGCTRGGVVQGGVLDAAHDDILRHHGLIEEVGRRLGLEAYSSETAAGIS